MQSIGIVKYLLWIEYVKLTHYDPALWPSNNSQLNDSGGSWYNIGDKVAQSKSEAIYMWDKPKQEQPRHRVAAYYML